MDLPSLAKRIADPFRFPWPWPELPLGARGIIGDGRSAALVRADGAIDWLCMPAFDSPSVFGALLDPQKGGLTAIRPVSEDRFSSLQRYDPDTNVLETLMTVDGRGVVRLTDFMPWTNDPRASNHEVHRRIQCVDGCVELDAIFDPRFGYGLEQTRLEVTDDGVLARGSSGDTMAAVLGGDGRWEERPEGGVTRRFTLRPGESRWMVLSWGAPRPEPLVAYRPFEYLRQTRFAWREWTRRLTYDGPWRHHVVRSALLLKLLIHAPTGAMVAAPTTSLPEWIGGSRNWDYRYVWTRDAAMAIRAGNLVGMREEARDFFHFMRRALAGQPDLKVMYSVDAQEVPDERELALAGFSGSTPVRVGNAAHDQLQLDTSGALVDAAYLFERFGGALSLPTWRGLRDVIDGVAKHWSQEDDGIWEPRGRRRHNVHSKLMSWLALDRGARIAPRFGDQGAAARWKEAAAQVRDEVLVRGLHSDGRRFVSAYDIEEPDGALLQLPLVGIVDAHDPRVVSTVEWIEKELGDGRFVKRYRGDDGIGGEEGAFVLCGFWLAEALAMMGKLDRAQEVFLAHADASNHLGLLAEEIDPNDGSPLGNFPQAFSHLGLINAATRIDLALRLRDEGSARVPHLMDFVETTRT